MLRRSCLFILCLLCLVESQYRFDCAEDFCSKKANECPPLNCEKGRIVHNVTTCGCCDLCLKNLKEGEECITKYHGWSDKITECGHGLICKEAESARGKCVPSKCLLKVRAYKEDYKKKKYLLSPSFQCDHFGNFEPVVCIDDVLCFCVDKNGGRIFGTDFAENNDTMKCDCSRDIQDFPREVDAENLPRCLLNGNYDPLQCTEEKCFCMEPTHYLDYEGVNNTSFDIKKLSCYDNVRHVDGRTTTCIRERQQQMKLFKKENLTVIGVDEVLCDLDGAYSPLQCKNGRCFCVDREGKIQTGYENVEKDKGRIICRCLRDKELVSSRNKDFEKIICSENYASDASILPRSFFIDFMK